ARVKQDWLRAHHQPPPHEPRVKQQPQGKERLHRFTQAHLVGEQRGVSRHEEGDALELVGERLERDLHLLAGEEILQRRLQQVEEPGPVYYSFSSRQRGGRAPRRGPRPPPPPA